MHQCPLGRRRLPFYIIVILGIAACSDGPTPPPVAQEACTSNGSLSVALYGDIRGELAWNGSELSCSGMPRPNGAGARLRFAGALDDGARTLALAFIVGLPELARGRGAREIPATVTLMEEDTGRFYSTTDAGVCWSDVHEHEVVDGNQYSLAGRVYCVAPLAEINGAGGVTLSDLEFRGRVDWSEPQ